MYWLGDVCHRERVQNFLHGPCHPSNPGQVPWSLFSLITSPHPGERPMTWGVFTKPFLCHSHWSYLPGHSSVLSLALKSMFQLAGFGSAKSSRSRWGSNTWSKIIMFYWNSSACS
jgi:hypothetical protein